MQVRALMLPVLAELFGAASGDAKTGLAGLLLDWLRPSSRVVTATLDCLNQCELVSSQLSFPPPPYWLHSFEISHLLQPGVPGIWLDV